MLTGNELASGGQLLMIIGGLSVWLRAIPEHIWQWIVSKTSICCKTWSTFEVRGDDMSNWEFHTIVAICSMVRPELERPRWFRH